jgi:hypothetical protein
MIKYIEFKGEKYPIKLGYYTLKMLKAETSKDLEEVLGDGTDITLFEPLLFYALEQGARYTGQEMPFKREDMEMVLDDCFFEFVGMIPDFFPNLQQKESTTKQKK